MLVPTYNEESIIERLLLRLLALGNVDVLVIDDSSPDGTGDTVEALGARSARISFLRQEAKEGLGRAYVAEFREALRRGYERVVTMNADLSHAPEDEPRLLGERSRDRLGELVNLESARPRSEEVRRASGKMRTDRRLGSWESAGMTSQIVKLS